MIGHAPYSRDCVEQDDEQEEASGKRDLAALSQKIGDVYINQMGRTAKFRLLDRARAVFVGRAPEELKLDR